MLIRIIAMYFRSYLAVSSIISTSNNIVLSKLVVEIEDGNDGPNRANRTQVLINRNYTLILQGWSGKTELSESAEVLLCTDVSICWFQQMISDSMEWSVDRKLTGSHN